MKYSLLLSTTLAMFATTGASAATFLFDTDPFAGTTALTTPGRQIVPNELFIDFDPATDRFDFDPNFFAFGNPINFANDVVGNLPASGLNVVVLRTFDNDGDPGTPFLAGTAANILANQITTDGAGAFIYFNSNLNLPRLVYSTNLNSNEADLKVLARMENLVGNSAALSNFTAENFSVVPEPATWGLLLLGFAAIGSAMRISRRKQRMTLSYS